MGFALASCGGNDDHESLFGSSSSTGAPETPESYAIEYFAVLNGQKSSVPSQMYKPDGKYPNYYKVGETATVDALVQEVGVDDDKMTFGGWFTDEACQTAFSGITADTTGKVTLYAKITVEDIISLVEYFAVLNGETMSIPAQMYQQTGNYPNSYAEGTAVTIDNLQAECEIDNYTFTFEGWFVDEACETAFAGITASTRGKVTVYAKISTEEIVNPIEYYAVVDGQKTSIPAEMYQDGKAYPITYEQGVSVTVDQLATEYTFETKKWTFEGWFIDEACQTAFTGITAQTTGKVTLYAKIKNTPIFAISYYMVTVDATTRVPAAMYLQDGNYPIKYLEGIAVTVDNLVQETALDGGKRIFVGWYTDEDCQTTFTGINAQTTGAVTLYAKCVDQYNIVYKAITLVGSEKTITQYLFEDGKVYPAYYQVGIEAKVDNLKSRYDGANQEWVFYGWYLDKALTIAFDGTIDVTQRGEIVLYAKVDYASWTSNY